MFQVSTMHLFRATQSEAQFLFKTAQQEFEVLMTHGDRVAIHSEFLPSHWAMPFIQRHHTAFQVGCKETCSIITQEFSKEHKQMLFAGQSRGQAACQSEW